MATNETESDNSLKLVKTALLDSLMEYHLEVGEVKLESSEYRLRQCCILYSLLDIASDIEMINNTEKKEI